MKRWPTKSLGELVDFVGGGTPRRDRPDYWGGEIPWASVKDLQCQSLETTLENITAKGLANSASNLIPKGTVIIASRVGLGKVAINLKPVAINQDLKALTPRSRDLSTRYLLLFLLSKAEYFERAGVGATVKGLTLADYQKLDIALPPLTEQERIVKLLDEADELRKLRTQSDRRTAALIPALFHEMFGDPKTNRYRLPVTELGSLCKILGGGTPSKKESAYWAGKIPWVSPKDMSGDEIHDSEDHISEQAVKESATNLIPKGSVLVVTRSGILKHTLPVAINSVPVTINQDIKAFIPNDNCEAVFLAGQLRVSTPTILNLVRVGATVHNIETEALRRLSVLNPPLTLQKEFAARVSEIRAIQAEQSASCRRFNDLFQTLLHRAFRGEL